MQNNDQQPQTLNDLNKAQTSSLACTWTLCGVTTIIIILRFVAQIRALRKADVNDVLIIIAWSFLTASAILCTIAISWGLGQHPSGFHDPVTYTNALKYEMCAATTSILCAMFSRISLSVFISYYALRLSKIRHLFIWSLISSQLVANIVPVALSWVRCKPPLSHPRVHINSELCYIAPHVVGWYYAQGAVNAASDLFLSLLSLGVVLRLKLRGCKMVGMGMLLSFSLLAAAAAVVGTVEVRYSRKSGEDFIYRVSTWNYWYSVENAVLIICSSVSKIKELSLLFHKRRNNSRDFNIPVENRGLAMEYSVGFRSLHSRNNSDIKGKSSTRIPSIQGTHYEPDSISRRGSVQLSCPPKTSNHSCQRPRQHRRNLSDSISFKSFPGPIQKGHSNTKQSSSERPFSRHNSCNDFTSPHLTSRTVISAGEGPRIPISLSLPASGRASREGNRRGDASPQSPSFPSTVLGTCDSPVSAAGYNPFCILKTDNFTVEYEDTNRENNPSQDVNLGWTTMRNEDSRLAEGDSYNESDADGLQLQDVGSILRHSQDQV
ncbi:hypothetical protein PISL3812_02422 [Talaromyces islandicus]|uniref:Rhodopsin domain-containing protein n=1 Tax=Talaromyces islandicus TaxID=28573 RepID=A0A0U1LQ73_TALIS|nr:hypothetical protein PISL3812_02422 [Talaromyces islandicus]